MDSNSRPTTDHVSTAEQLAALPGGDERYELVEGELRVMSPAGGRHGRVAMNLAVQLANHVKALQIGTVYAAETGFILARNPDTVRAPDVAFVRQSRVDGLDDTGFLPFAPDLAAEVISPSDSFSAVEEMAFAWLTAGTRLVLLVDPEARRVPAYRSADNIRVLSVEDELDAEDVVDQWRVEIATLYA